MLPGDGHSRGEAQPAHELLLAGECGEIETDLRKIVCAARALMPAMGVRSPPEKRQSGYARVARRDREAPCPWPGSGVWHGLIVALGGLEGLELFQKTSFVRRRSAVQSHRVHCRLNKCSSRQWRVRDSTNSGGDSLHRQLRGALTAPPPGRRTDRGLPSGVASGRRLVGALRSANDYELGSVPGHVDMSPSHAPH